MSENKLIANRYKVMNTLGQGGMGSVLLCLDTTLQREVAVKVLSKNSDDGAVKRFQIEAIAAAKLKHDNILQVMDFGETEGRLFLVMDYLNGITLAALIKRESYLEPDVAIPIFMQICDGISHAHKREVLHRDVKPSNIMLVPGSDSKWIVKIVDFGIARLKTISDQRLTATGVIVGSPLYLSPEAALGQVCDNRSDVYSLGCLMFETLTGNPPFYGDTAFDTVMMHANDQPPTLSKSTGRQFEESLESIVAKCLAKDGEHRYQSAEQLHEDLSKHYAALDSKLQHQEPESRSPMASRSTPFHGVDQRLFLLMLICLAIATYIALPALLALLFKPDPKPTITPTESEDLSGELFILRPNRKAVQVDHGVDDKQLLKYAPKYSTIRVWTLDSAQIEGPGLRALPIETTGLELKNTLIGKQAIETVSKMKHLSYLDIRECDRVHPEDLKPLERLEGLSEFQFSIPQDRLEATKMINAVTQLQKIEVLGIDGDLDAGFIPKLKKLSHLRELHMEFPHENFDSVAMGKALSEFPGLTALHMNDDSMNAITMTEFAKRSKLTKLKVSLPKDRNEANKLMQAILRLNHLSKLTIRGELDVEIIKAVRQLPELKELTISKRRQTPDTQRELNHLPSRIYVQTM